jgi:uncharacterized protein with FMN-binding domain
MFKKIAASVLVVAAFIIYTVHARGQTTTVGSIQTTATATAAPAVATSTVATTSTAVTPDATAAGMYKDGTYTGNESDAIYGYVKVKVTISGGKVSDIVFLEHPTDQRNSIEINNYAMPRLTAQAITSQSSRVDGVSGATDTSQAFVKSLENALQQAKA